MYIDKKPVLLTVDGIPFEWLDIEGDEKARRLFSAVVDSTRWELP